MRISECGMEKRLAKSALFIPQSAIRNSFHSAIRNLQSAFPMHLIPRQLLADRLCAVGYLRSASPDTLELSQAVRTFQADHGLPVDGWPGPQTRRALFDPHSHFCGVV